MLLKRFHRWREQIHEPYLPNDPSKVFVVVKPQHESLSNRVARELDQAERQCLCVNFAGSRCRLVAECHGIVNQYKHALPSCSSRPRPLRLTPAVEQSALLVLFALAGFFRVNVLHTAQLDVTALQDRTRLSSTTRLRTASSKAPLQRTCCKSVTGSEYFASFRA
eukprot:815843-Amphidinium_carterae.1